MNEPLENCGRCGQPAELTIWRGCTLCDRCISVETEVFNRTERLRLDLAERDKQLEWAPEMIKKAPREATCKSEENMNIAYGPKDPSTEVMTEETDLQIASRVRMLSRCDTYHEIVCMAGRDRIMRLHHQLAERDKQVAELSVSGGELIERWHTAIDQRDEANRKLAAAELRIAEVRKASILARETAVFISMVAPSSSITVKESDRLDTANAKLRELSRILSALSEERET